MLFSHYTGTTGNFSAFEKQITDYYTLNVQFICSKLHKIFSLKL